MGIHIGDAARDFTADAATGKIRFRDRIGGIGCFPDLDQGRRGQDRDAVTDQ